MDRVRPGRRSRREARDAGARPWRFHRHHPPGHRRCAAWRISRSGGGLVSRRGSSRFRHGRRGIDRPAGSLSVGGGKTARRLTARATVAGGSYTVGLTRRTLWARHADGAEHVGREVLVVRRAQERIRAVLQEPAAEDLEARIGRPARVDPSDGEIALRMRLERLELTELAGGKALVQALDEGLEIAYAFRAVGVDDEECFDGAASSLLRKIAHEDHDLAVAVQWIIHRERVNLESNGVLQARGSCEWTDRKPSEDGVA